MDHRFVVVDLETTGNSPKTGERIIQLSAVIIEGEKITGQYSTFINPEIPIPAFIEELTGINDDMVRSAPLFKEIADEIVELFSGSIFVAHNVLFDLSFLKGELVNAGLAPFDIHTIDTVELAKILMPTAESYKLVELSDYFSFTHERPHQADSDAYVTAELLLRLISMARELPLVTIEKLAVLSPSLKSNVEVIFEELAAEKKRSIPELPADLEVFRGIALRRNAEKEMDQKDYRVQAFYPHSLNDKEKLLTPHIKHYQRREGQFEMMDIVLDSFQQNRHSVIEAGTGIGKSLAYLLPSCYFAVKSGARVVISTYTTQLQEQLLQHELKSLAQMVPFPFKAALLKGRNHYPNLFKFEQSLKDEDSQYDSILTKMQILVWLTFTATGDVDELNLSSGGNLYWNRIKQDGWHLSKERDPWRKKDFYVRAMQAAESADIVITNHSMLLSNAARSNSQFPPFEYLVIDEAHHLEQTARQYFGLSLRYVSSKFLLARVKTSDKKQILSRIQSLMEANNEVPKVDSLRLDSAVSTLEQDLDDMFQMLSQLFIKESKRKSKLFQKVQIRLNEAVLESQYWKAVKLCAERAVSSLKFIQRAIIDRLDTLNKISNKLEEKDQSLLEEVYTFAEEWNKLQDHIRTLFLKTPEMSVIWLEGDLRSLPNSLYIKLQPVTVQEELSRNVMNKTKSTILTSASLTVNQSFTYFLSEIGLSSYQNVCLKRISSPFDYQNNARLIIPNDIPDIKKVSSLDYAEAIANHLIPIAQATKGRMLVLFTAYDLLKTTFDLMKQSGLLDDFMLIAQGISTGSRTKLTKNFQRFEKAILFGMNSFWEGVDLPGEDLSCLVMVRLPFSPPDEPIIEAKNEYLKTIGKNPFSAYALPEAVLRFKQGFGRLIRSRTDKGIVIVFDRRIETTLYGKEFIKSIPDLPIRRSSLNDIIDFIERWL